MDHHHAYEKLPIINTQVFDNDGREPVYTMDEALAAVGFGKFQALVLAYAGLGSMAEAMEVMILSFIGPSVKEEWGLSSAQESLITTMVFAGMLIGSYFWGVIADNFGRRVGLGSVAVVTSIFAFLSAVSPNYVLLILFRLVVGFGLGGAPVYSSWFLEFVPVQSRGFWMVMFSSCWTIGTILEAALAWIIVPRWGWRWLLVVSSVPCFLALILYFFTVETPRYLYLNGKISEAHGVLKKMATINNTELPPGKLVFEFERTSNRNEDFTPLQNQLLHAREQEPNKAKSGQSSIFTLFSPSLLKTTLLLWVVYFGNSFSYYGVVLMTSELSSGDSKCSKSSSSNLLTDSSLYINVFITSFAEVPGLVLSAILLDKIGRKMSMLLMYVCGFICLLPIMFQQREVVSISLLFGARMFITGNFKVAGVYCPELYPTSVRTTGAGVASAVGRVAGMICPLVAVELVSGCHRMAAISLFEIATILCGICVLLFPIETKGRKLSDIVTENI